MIWRTHRSSRSDTLFPYTALFCSQDLTMPRMPDAVDTQATYPMAADAAAGPAILVQQEGDHQLAEDYIGAKVVSRSDAGLEDIGTVADLVLGPDDKIVGVVVDVGGFLGVGAKPVGLS